MNSTRGLTPEGASAAVAPAKGRFELPGGQPAISGLGVLTGRGRRRWALVGIAVASLLLLETLARCFDPGPTRGPSAYFVSSAGTSRLRPGLTRTFQTEGGQRVRFSTNRLGLPHSAALLPQPSDRPTFAVLGDALAMGLSASDYRRSLIGVAAAESSAGDPGFANFAVAGHDAEDMLARLREDAFALLDDELCGVVLVRSSAGGAAHAQSSETCGDGRCVFEAGSAWLARYSVAWSLLLERRARTEACSEQLDGLTGPEDARACSLTEERLALDEIAGECARRGVPLLVVFAPRSVADGSLAETQDPLRGELQAFCERVDAPLLDLTDELRALRDDGTAIDGHCGYWNDSAHATAGRALARFVADRGTRVSLGR